MNKLNSFMGIPFGSSREFVTEKMLDREGVFDEENSSENCLFFDSVQFAGYKTNYIVVKFFDNQFCYACAYIKPTTESKVFELYEYFQEELNIKYYKTDKCYENYDPPYEKDDGRKEEAVSLGKASFISFWFFHDYDDYKDSITLEINDGFNLQLSYEKVAIYSAYVDRLKERNREDL
jgi:hypothetical protein